MTMNAAIFQILADSFERTAISLRQQADHHGIGNPTGNALLCASYNAGTMRAAALDAVDYLKGRSVVLQTASGEYVVGRMDVGEFDGVR